MRTEPRASLAAPGGSPRWMLLSLGAVLLALLVAMPHAVLVSPAFADDAKGEDAKKDGDVAKGDAKDADKAAPKRESLLPKLEADWKPYKSIISAARREPRPA